MRSILRSRAATVVVLVALLAAALPSAVSAGGVGAARTTAGAAGPSGRAAAAPCVRGAKACPIRIVFRRGAYAAQATSRLANQSQERWFSVKATKGQTMVVVIDGKGATGGTLYFPNGTQDGGPGGRVFDGEVPASGVTRIRVTESLMAEPWTGLVTVVVLIY
jgi:hypothetical protein